jgi:hypothetical protein
MAPKNAKALTPAIRGSFFAICLPNMVFSSG